VSAGHAAPRKRAGPRPVSLPLVLASASPRRRLLMKSLPWRFQVRPSRVPEPEPRGRVMPGSWALKLARLKARAAAAKLKEGLVLGADTLVYQKGKIYGKPSSRAHARRILRVLAEDWHTVHTGVVLKVAPAGPEWSETRATRVKMRRFTEEELDYWSAKNHDKAGAYAAQEKRDPFVVKFDGDYDNVVGLPMRAVKRLLAQARREGFVPE
jgi:septum formation protein